jgi:tetratricopeptide (TPR) repeat protein
VQSDRPPSGNLEAYNAYLQGQFHFARDTETDYRKAIESYKAAIALDPKYALAYAALSLCETILSDYSPVTAKQILADARAAVDTALVLNPDLAAGHNARGVLLLFTDIDVAATEVEFKRALQLAPNDPNAKASLAQARAALGHPEAAIEPIRQAIAADPLSAGWYSLLIGDLMAVGRLDEAEAATHAELALHATNGALARLSAIETLRGNAPAAVEKAEQVPAGKPRDFALANARQIGSDRGAADAALKTLIDRYADTDAYLISRTYALRKEPDKVFEWLDRAWANRDNNISILYYDPFLLRYKTDPRFAVFCKKIGAEAAQCLQGRRRLRRRRLADYPSFFNRLADVSRAGVGCANARGAGGAWLPDRARDRVGVRAHAGRNQANRGCRGRKTAEESHLALRRCARCSSFDRSFPSRPLHRSKYR